MARVAYALAVLRWPLAQTVIAGVASQQEPSARRRLHDLFENSPNDFAVFLAFLDGWDRAHLLGPSPTGDSILQLIHTREAAEGLEELHPSKISEAKAGLEQARRQAAAGPTRPDGYATKTLLDWLDSCIGFVESTGLPLLIAHDVLGPTIDDADFRAG